MTDNQPSETKPKAPNPPTSSSPLDTTSPIDLSRLHGQTILITGGASGIGAAFARHWSSPSSILNQDDDDDVDGNNNNNSKIRKGANIIIGDIDIARGTTLIAELRSHTNSADHHFLQLDVTDWSSQVRFFQDAVRLSPHGGIDCVVVNAGVNVDTENRGFENPGAGNSADIGGVGQGGSRLQPPPPPPPQFKTLDVNLTGALYTTYLAQYYLPLNPGSLPCSSSSTSSPSTTTPPTPANTNNNTNINTNRDRHILLLASLAGLLPLPTQPLYSTSKHAIVGLFRNLRLTAPITHGIRVNMLCPYFIDTPILGTVGRLLMAGGAMVDIRDVVAAATRFVCHPTRISGRGVAVGPGLDGVQVLDWVGGDGLPSSSGRNSTGRDGDVDGAAASAATVWDVYAHDHEASDVFARRMIAITNLIAAKRGVWGLITDLVVATLAAAWAKLRGV